MGLGDGLIAGVAVGGGVGVAWQVLSNMPNSSATVAGKACFNQRTRKFINSIIIGFEVSFLKRARFCCQFWLRRRKR